MSVEALNRPKPNEMSVANNAFARSMAERAERQEMYKNEIDRLFAAVDNHLQQERIKKKQIPNDYEPFSNEEDPSSNGFMGALMEPGIELNLDASQKDSNPNENKGPGWTTEYFGGFGELSASKEVGSEQGNGIGGTESSVTAGSENGDSGDSGDSEY